MHYCNLLFSVVFIVSSLFLQLQAPFNQTSSWDWCPCHCSLCGLFVCCSRERRGSLVLPRCPWHALCHRPTGTQKARRRTFASVPSELFPGSQYLGGCVALTREHGVIPARVAAAGGMRREGKWMIWRRGLSLSGDGGANCPITTGFLFNSNFPEFGLTDSSNKKVHCVQGCGWTQIELYYFVLLKKVLIFYSVKFFLAYWEVPSLRLHFVFVDRFNIIFFCSDK